VTTVAPGGIATDFAMGSGRTPDMPDLEGMMTPEEVADVVHARAELGLGAIVVANPLDEPLDAGLHARVVREGLEAAAREGVRGRDVTPFLLDRLHAATAGESLRANVRLVLRNAALAARIAACIA
jgi:pseudouridine-5'-phosphate glycosidase